MLEFTILGRTLRADLGGPAQLRGHWADWLHTHWLYPQHRLPSSPFTITLHRLESAPPLNTSDWSTLELMAWQVPARLRDSQVSFGDLKSGAHLEINGDSAQITFWGATPSLGAMLHALISESLRASGLLSLHASAGAQDGRVTAFLGVSGAGKTTTLLRAWSAGWQPICEDLLWLAVDTLQVFGWDRGLRLLPDTLKRFGSTVPALQNGATQTDKWFVPYESLALEPVTGRLAGLALLQRGESDFTQWQAASRRETALALWQATGLPLTVTSQTQVAAAIVSLTGRLEGKRLMLGREDFSPLPTVAPPLDSERTA